MGVTVATACLHWSQPSVSHSPSSVSSPALERRSFSDGALLFCIQRLDRSARFGSKLYRSLSCEIPKSRSQTIRRSCSASLNPFSDEDFPRKIQELAVRFQSSDDEDDSDSSKLFENRSKFVENGRPFDPIEPPERPATEGIIPTNMEWKANIVDLPFSIRIIKRKKQNQWRDGFREAGESAYSSVNKAFSSMVFIIRELHCFSLQMSEKLLYKDLQGILARVQNEMHASFVWLFQQVFSHTPTLMVYVMILLANYSVHSMASHATTAPPPQSYASVSVFEDQSHKQHKFDSKAIKTCWVSPEGDKTASIGGNNGGGGGKFRPVGSGTDGDEPSLNYNQSIFSDGASSVGAREEELASGREEKEEELGMWNSMVEAATRTQADLRGENLDHEAVQRFVLPVTAKIEEDDFANYFGTVLFYRMGLAQDPSNSLLLSNYAQFLCLIVHDQDRAEEYFKRAAKVEPPDAEALSKYASFLWQVRKDLWAAEETYLEAISADPTNSYYAANYAHFLWSTGGEDTCFPIDIDTDTIDI